jgi:hypothetical protein
MSGVGFTQRSAPRGNSVRWAYPAFPLHACSANWRARLDDSLSPKQAPFNTETWIQGGLRYFVIGDASAADIDGLAKLFKAAL